jgi:hypothetical protein
MKRSEFLKNVALGTTCIMVLPFDLSANESISNSKIISLPTNSCGGWVKARKHSFEQGFPVGKESNGSKLYASQTVHGIGNTGWLAELGSDVRKVFNKLDKVYIELTYNGDGSSSVKPKGKTVKDGNWHIGKAGTHLADGCAYSYAGKEYNAIEHYVFCPKKTSDYKWVKSNGKKLPKGAVVGWNKNELQAVARMNWAGGIHPGKFVKSSGACYIGYGGKEEGKGNCEILVKKL